jgi:hypothetical protein
MHKKGLSSTCQCCLGTSCLLPHPLQPTLRQFPLSLGRSSKALPSWPTSRPALIPPPCTTSLACPKNLACLPHRLFFGPAGEPHACPTFPTRPHAFLTFSPLPAALQFLSQLVNLQGIVTRATLVRPKLQKSVHYCPTTNAFTTREYRDVTSNAGPPTSTVYPTKDDNGNLLVTQVPCSAA